MPDTELVAPTDPVRAAGVFRRDGFLAIADALTRGQLEFARTGARLVVDEQMAAIPLDDANRGFVVQATGHGRPLPMARFEELSMRGREMWRHIADLAAPRTRPSLIAHSPQGEM